MAFGRKTISTRVALAIVFTIGGPFTAGAQNRPRGVPEPYTPAADAKDLKAVLFRWMWGMGMLKGHDERDMVATLEYQGKGTIEVEGQPCTLTRYRASTNYQTFSQRVQYAWDEDTSGAQIGSTKGKTVPMPGTVQERLVRIWAGPQGAPKAAVATLVEAMESLDPALLDEVGRIVAARRGMRDGS